VQGLLQVPFGSLCEVRASIRYRWDSARRGTDPFVIMQCTQSGEGMFELEGKAHRVPPGHAFLALIPEPSRYYYHRGAAEPWVFSWVNFYGELAQQLWLSLRNRAGPVIPLRPETMRSFRRLIVRAAGGTGPIPMKRAGRPMRFTWRCCGRCRGRGRRDLSKM
jgi:hypothetical protein